MKKAKANKKIKKGAKRAKSFPPARSVKKKAEKFAVYDPKKIEAKQRVLWKKEKIYYAKEDKLKEKYYVLDMFPYPSGEGLHVGHPKGYIATDVVSRFERMNGKSILHPMGFDAFGLPAENYALKTKTNPEIAVKKNVLRYKKQLEILGFDYDWSREVNTTDPKFYKWTQWIFVKLFKKGLAYQSYEPINWCPSCKTGLANEDVEDGRCERCGTPVEKKPMRQWVLRITDYAERLLADLDLAGKDGRPLIDWPQLIKEMQRNWIGRSEGSLISFSLKGKEEKIEIFTTRPDTIYGVSYVVLAPEHPMLQKLLPDLTNRDEVSKYIEETKKRTMIERTDAKKEKSGIELSGVKVINPANKEEVPVWVADYVLYDYGTGAVMAVPAHDERDFAFAKKFNLPIKEVIIPERIDKRNPPVAGKQFIERRNVHVIVRNPSNGKYLLLKWKKHDWRTFPMGGIEENEDVIEAARREVKEETGYTELKNPKVLGGEVRAEYFAAHKDVNRVSYTRLVTFDLAGENKVEIEQKERDDHDAYWADEKELNVVDMTHAEMDVWLQRLKGENAFVEEGIMINSGKFNGSKSSEIKKEITESVGGKWTVKYKIKDWVFSRQRYWGEPIPVIHCEKCGVVAVPEKDLPVKLPKVKRYEPTGTGESPLASISKWVNVKCPNCKGPGKRETNTMPQWAGSSWYYLRYKDPNNSKAMVDPKKEKYWGQVDLYVGGAEHAARHLIYARFWHKFLYDIGVVGDLEPFKRLQHVGLIMGEDGRKMSKRFGNVVNPDQIVKTYGADTMRLYEMFMGPFDQQISWNTDSIIGSRRFLEKIWKLKAKVGKNSSERTLKVIHKSLKKVTEDIRSLRFNTAISSMMIAQNELEKEEEIGKKEYEYLLQMAAPFAPHMADFLYRSLGNKKSIHISKWPEYDPRLTVESRVRIMVQVNGKLRGNFEAEIDASDDKIRELATNLPEIRKWTEGKKIGKVVIVKNRLVNFVLND